MSSIIDKYKANIILDWDFQAKTLLDQSGNSRTPTATGVVSWRNGSKKVGVAMGANGYVAATSLNLTITRCTVLIFADFKRTPGATNQHFMDAWTSGTTYPFQLYHDGTNLHLVSNNDSTLAVSMEGAKMFGFRLVTGGRATIFKDGSVAGEASNTNTLSGTTNTISIGNYLTTPAIGNSCNFPHYRVVVLDTDAITSEEISEFYNEEMLRRSSGDPKPQNFKWLNNPINNEFRTDSYWTKGTGWTIANGKASSDGSQSANSDLEQSGMLEVGRLYTIEYKVSGRSAGTINVLAGTTVGTAKSADGVYTERLVCAGNTKIILRADADFVGSVEYIKVHQGNKLLYYPQPELWLPTLANVTAGRLSNTDFSVLTGSYKISQDANKKKWIECVTAGVAYAPMTYAEATWLFELNKPDGTIPRIGFMASVAGDETATGQNAYWVLETNAELIGMKESVAGSASFKNSTAAGYTPVATDHKIPISRTSAGVFTLYIQLNGVWTSVDMSGGTGTNPFTDTTTTTSRYMILDLDAGDKVRPLGIFQGVLNPLNGEIPNL